MIKNFGHIFKTNSIRMYCITVLDIVHLKNEILLF